MPLYESPPEAVDKVYAKSLFELAEGEGGRERLESLNGELDELVELTRSHADLSEFLSSRIIGTEERRGSLDTIFGGGRVSPLLLRFLQVLNSKDRLNRLLSIIAAYDQMVQERFGRIEINVYTRHPLAEDQKSSLAQRLQRAVGREPVLYAYTDETMIGGMKMQVGDRLIDASIRTQLRAMKELMSGEGSTLMRERFDRAVEDGE
ncbi:MAG: ATP synthase F1 subunit delta [Phycisphaerales bacterium]